MEMLAQQIESALETRKEYFVRPAELERVWPNVEADKREDVVREFARQHGWRIFESNGTRTPSIPWRQ